MSNDRTKRLAQQGRLNRRAFLRVTGTAAAAASVGAAGLFGRRGSAPAADPKRGGTLRILQIEPAVGFNPVLEGGNWPETQRMVYNGLTDFSPTSELVPGLARSWTVSEAADTFTFQLTPGVKFHDGHDLTAEDVKFTYEMVVDSTVGSPFAGYLPNLKSVEATPRYLRKIPYGQPTLPSTAWTEGLTLVSVNGRQAVWKITGETIERRDGGPQPQTGFVTSGGCQPSNQALIR